MLRSELQFEVSEIVTFYFHVTHYLADICHPST